jgi:hypothetical protein
VLPYWPRDRYLELAPKFWSEYPLHEARSRGGTSEAA